MIIALAPQIHYACTMIFWNDNTQAKVAARSTDLYVSDMPLLFVQPRGIERDGEGGENSLKWKSKYGSVVITAFHTTTVSDGMNEHGLIAHLLYLQKTDYGKRDEKRPALGNGLWAQYMLDNFKTVDEALAASKNLQIVSMKVHDKEWPLHLAIEDAQGNSAMIEFINGEMKVYQGQQYHVLTNEPAYSIQLKNLKRYKLFGGTLPLPGDVDPLSRFVRASSFLKTLPAPKNYIEAIAGALSVMRTVMVPFGAEDTSGSKLEDSWPTRWISLADTTNRIYFFSATTAPNIIWVDYKNLNFAEGAPLLALDPADPLLIGEVTRNLKKPV